jgi:hypothetical protein
MSISWDDAVKEGIELVKDTEYNQWRLGRIACELEPIYKESTLAQYAQAIGINQNTLQNYRPVYRTWNEDSNRTNPTITKFSIVKALVAHPDRAKIVEENQELTEKEAKEETKKYKESKAAYERYTNQAMHKLTKRIVTRLNLFLKKDSKLDEMLNDVVILNNADLEYIEKITSALGRVNERVVALYNFMGLKKELYEMPTGENDENAAPEESESSEADSETLEVEDMGTREAPFRKGESDD